MPLSRPVAVSLADPSGGPSPCTLFHGSTIGADLQDVWVDQFTAGGQRVTHCTCFQTGRHLATFTRRPGSSLYTLTTASPLVTTSGKVAASGQVFAAASKSSLASAPCSCRPLSHKTLLWHHRLGHPSLPRLRGMASRTLISGLPRSLPPLPPGPAPTCVPSVEGQQRAAPHSSEFPPTEAPMQTLHMDVWGPARVCGQGHERYFLLVVDDYSRYTTVFPLRRKDRGGEFSSDLLRAFCRAEGIRQTFTLPASPQQNGIAECHIGMVMDVARMSMIHAAAPHFLWPFAVQYAAHQLNLQPRVSLPETTPTLRWTGKVGDASVFLPDAPGWQFYHPTSRRVLSSQDVTFDESVSYYRLFPYRTTPPPPPPPLFLAPGAPPVDPVPPQGPAPSGVSQVDPVELVEVAVDSSAARGTEPAGAGPGGAERGVAESEGAEPGGAEPGAGAMAAQELRWLTYLLTDLGEAPRSPPVLDVDNKAMLALCQEHRVEPRTKHIALRYFLARELQQRGQLRLAYVASQANTADVFTKALQPCDHQRLAGGVVVVVAATDVVSTAADVSATVDVVSAAADVSAAVDVVSACRIVANALVRSASAAAAATTTPLATAIAAAVAAAAAAADSRAGFRTTLAVAWCRLASLHLSRSNRCSPRFPLWPHPPTGLGASVAEVPVASVGTCVDTSLGASPEDTSLSFTLDPGASHCFFHDHTTLTPLPAPSAVCVDGDTYAPLATFSVELGSGLYTLHTSPRGQQQLQPQQWQLLPPTTVTALCQVPLSHQVVVPHQVAVSGQVPVSGLVAVSCSCRSLAHPTVLWHHRLGHPSIPCLRAMSTQRLVLGLPRILPSLPPSLAPPCGPCVEGQLRATPHSSLRPATEPFETLHLDVTSTLIRWLLTTADTRGRRVSCLHSDCGGEFRSIVLAGFCREQGIRQSWSLPESPQQNGVAKNRIGLVMEIAHTSLTHARAPHFLWPCVVRYAAHQLNLRPHVSRPEVSPTSLWTGSPGVASRFLVGVAWHLFATPPQTRSHLAPFLVSPLVSHRTPLTSPFTTLPFTGSLTPVTSISTSPSPTKSAPQVQPPSPRSSSQPTADPAGAGVCGEDPGGASYRGVGVGAESVPVQGPGSRGTGVKAEPVPAGASSPRGAGVSRAVPGGATTEGAGASTAGPGESWTGRVAAGGADSGGGATGAAGVGARGERVGAAAIGATTPGGAATATAGAAAAAVAGAAGAAAAGAAAVAAAAAGVAGAAAATAAAATSASYLWSLDPRSPLSFSSPLPLSPCLRLPRSSPSVLPSPPESALTASLSTPVTDYYRAFRPVLSRVLASLVTDPRAYLSSVSALTTAVTKFASTRHLEYATSLVAAPPTSPLAVGGDSALGCDALEDRQFELEFLAAASPHLCAMLLAPEGDPNALDIPTPRTYVEAVSGPWASQWRAAMDSEMASHRSTGTYVDEVPPPWGERSRWHVDLQAHRNYELHSLNFSTAFLQGSLHEEVWLRRPSAFTGNFPPGTQWRLRRPVYGLRHAPREWRATLCSTLSDPDFQPSSADPLLFVRRGSTPFFVLVYIDDLVFASGDRVALADMKRELQKRHTCTDLGELHHYLGLQITRDRAARTITLSQSYMVQQVLQLFELQHSTVQRTPLVIDHRLTGPFPDKPFEPSGPYAELVGCLMYLMTCTRLDIAFLSQCKMLTIE
ncbi:unnamed protein product [Closterium sp. NIES-53]